MSITLFMLVSKSKKNWHAKVLSLHAFAINFLKLTVNQ